jgi:hypothetical protein
MEGIYRSDCDEAPIGGNTIVTTEYEGSQSQQSQEFGHGSQPSMDEFAHVRVQASHEEASEVDVIGVDKEPEREGRREMETRS